MDSLNNTINHSKHKHLTFKERVIIQTRLKDGYSPYKIGELGANERHNELLRHFIPKGIAMNNFTVDDIALVEDWCNIDFVILGNMQV